MTRHDQPATMPLRAALWPRTRLVPTNGYPDLGPWRYHGESRGRPPDTPQRRLRRQHHASIYASASLAQTDRKLKSP